MAPRLRMTPTAVLLWHRNLHTPHSTMAIDSGNPVCPRLGWPHRPQSGCPVRRDERSEGLKLNEIRNTRHEIRDTKVSKRETRRERHLNATLTVYILCTVHLVGMKKRFEELWFLRATRPFTSFPSFPTLYLVPFSSAFSPLLFFQGTPTASYVSQSATPRCPWAEATR